MAQSRQIDRSLPACEDNERVVIASLLYTPRMLPDVVHRLYPTMLRNAECSLAYRAMIRLMIRRISIDIVTLAEECRRINKSKDLTVFLAGLLTDTATTPDLDHHIERIRDADMRRQVIYLARDAYDEDADIRRVIREIERTAGESGQKRSRIVQVEDFWLSVDSLYSDGVKPGLDTGWNELNKFYTVAPGFLNIVTGIPSHGKSEFLDALVVNLSRLHGFKVAYYSPENRPWSFHFQKLAEKVVNAPFFGEGRMEPSELQRAKEWIEDRFYWLAPDRRQRTVTELLRLSEIAVEEYGVKVFVFDPWNQIDHSCGYGIREDRYISDKLSEIGDFIKDTGSIFYLVAHTTKLQKDVKTKQYPCPTLYDISGGAQWFNKADFGLVVYREEHEVQVHVQKVKFKVHGEKGMQPFVYDRKSGRYRAIETGFETPTQESAEPWWNR